GGIGQLLIGTTRRLFLMRIMAEFGSEALAGYVIASRVMMFTLMLSWGMSNAAATLVGQDLGVGKVDFAEKSVRLTSKYNAYFMLLLSLIYLFFAKNIIGLFKAEPDVIYYGAMALQIVAVGYVLYAYGMVVTQAFNGAGDTKTPTIINFFCFWLFQIPFAYLTALVFNFGPIGVFLAITLAEVLIAIIAIVWFKRGKW